MRRSLIRTRSPTVYSTFTDSRILDTSSPYIQILVGMIMTSRRVLKIAEAVREIVSMAIITDLNDPRIQDVTVTFVEVTPDLRQAKVHVSVRGDESKQQLSLHGLRNAAGFLQQKLSRRVETRYTPKIQFELDMGVKRSLEITKVLDNLAKERAASDSNEEVSDADGSRPD